MILSQFEIQIPFLFHRQTNMRWTGKKQFFSRILKPSIYSKYLIILCALLSECPTWDIKGAQATKYNMPQFSRSTFTHNSWSQLQKWVTIYQRKNRHFVELPKDRYFWRLSLISIVLNHTKHLLRHRQPCVLSNEIQLRRGKLWMSTLHNLLLPRPYLSY